MPGIISLREGCYGPWEAAVEWAPKAGITHLEINVRPLADLETIAAGAKARGVKILTLSGGVMLSENASVEDTAAMIAACAKVEAPVFFISANGADMSREQMMGRLRHLGDVAGAHGVTLALETHPPFCKNAEGMLQTMAEVNHPNVRLNLDTANVFYYNHGLDSADELERVIAYVASLHLKDTDGGFESMNFPALGEGVVRFPRVREILAAASFTGPLTLELEGPVLDGLTVEGKHEVIVRCVEYLRKVGIV